ncbi:ABC transporter ATP-binding protein [Marinobacterium sp. AK62]|uniref:Quaternary amine transport ATP-binding protein n=1 Tax=Marinobacterium alkalitolerans TaxID=1542925 RepID=A0ABS3Z9C1_9GAMM|nr:ABC transporter ATP-binding protein [Marinobacterium alkalitolerans]MBP0048272.1 ABC transporter ATP-binding protein [Marinobacterium alkalitolerans]
MIRIDNLTKIFETPNGPVTAADHINMEVPEGEICVLLGPSGCGKTTTLKMINRIIPSTSGRIYINGEDTTGMDTVELRRNIGYVIQQIGLFPNMTIEENIAIVPKLLGWEASRYKARAKELLDLVALDPGTFLKRYPRELSGGQQQRIGVARALAADPPVMLMDEPFGAIDPINREVIQDEFMKMQQELRKTIMFVSHDIDEAVKMADRIAIFRDGRLVQYDTPDDLLAHPKDDFVESFVGDDRALKRLRLVQVKQVMEPVTTVRPEDSLSTALQRIEQQGYSHAILMVNERQQPIGYVSRSVAQTTSGLCGEHYFGLKTEASPEDDLRKVASLMFTHDTTWLPCTDANGTLVGQVTQRGITHYLGATYHPDALGTLPRQLHKVSA